MRDFFHGVFHVRSVEFTQDNGQRSGHSYSELFSEFTNRHEPELCKISFTKDGLWSAQREHWSMETYKYEAPVLSSCSYFPVAHIQWSENPSDGEFYAPIISDQFFSHKDELSAELHFSLPIAMADAIGEEGVTIAVLFKVVDYVIKEDNSKTSARGRLHVADIRSIRRGMHTHQYLVTAAKKYSERYFFEEHKWTQVARIFDEYCASLAAVSGQLDDYINCINDLNGIIKSFRVYLRDPNYMTGRGEEDPWDKNKEEFSSFMKKYGDDLNKAEREYNTLWKSLDFSRVFAVGEDEIGPLENGFHFGHLNEIEHLISEYRLMKFRSPTFERLCIDLLAYAELHEFARATSLVNIEFLSLPSKIVGSKDRLRKQFKKVLWSLFSESLKIGVTFLGIALVPNLSGTSILAFALAITLFRWLPRQKDTQEHQTAELMKKMAAINFEITNYVDCWNAGLIQTLVRNAAISGVSYKPEIHHMLDRLVKDEEGRQ